ncbi:hypothetical protein PN502_07830 [Microcystis aeruginosa CS-338/01]|uniref:hypothetical protein n=1 Tax=Microcystis aeruginosa TaxID=1126 RepID=UPI00232CDFBD|nr:hypothetical protein [Microcystis aeruginosa]MDB9506998.1 hypothetical protein [Microcystis aeruginosa CS-338/01]
MTGFYQQQQRLRQAIEKMFSTRVFLPLAVLGGGLDVIFGFYQQKPLERRKNADQQLEKFLLSCQEKMSNFDVLDW